MQRQTDYLLTQPLDLESCPSFNVVIAYEDFESGKHARKTYNYLAESLAHECQFENQMWKFDILRIPKLREIAAHDAAEADIIMISSHGGCEMSGDVRLWIEAWVVEPVRAIALVALFDRPREQTLEARNYLAEVARRGQMAFFAQPDDWPELGISSGREPSEHAAEDGTQAASSRVLLRISGEAG